MRTLEKGRAWRYDGPGARPTAMAVMAVANVVVRLLLHSPLHGLVSDSLLLMSPMGHTSGKRHTIPVGALAEWRHAGGTASRACGRSTRVSWAPIPASHRDLVAGGYCAALTTIMPNGQPQITPVWCNLDGGDVLVNTMRGFRKERNMRGNPRVTLLAYDPKRPLRHIEVRGVVVEITEEGALEHLDQLTRLYLHKADARFFGDSVPAELRATYAPVKVRIAPFRVRVEG